VKVKRKRTVHWKNVIKNQRFSSFALAQIVIISTITSIVNLVPLKQRRKPKTQQLNPIQEHVKPSYEGFTKIPSLLFYCYKKYIFYKPLRPRSSDFSAILWRLLLPSPIVFLRPNKKFYFPFFFSKHKLKSWVWRGCYNNDSLPPKYTTFHHIVYVVRWSFTLIYF
jgi:hypothetical protein